MLKTRSAAVQWYCAMSGVFPGHGRLPDESYFQLAATLALLSPTLLSVLWFVLRPKPPACCMYTPDLLISWLCLFSVVYCLSCSTSSLGWSQMHDVAITGTSL